MATINARHIDRVLDIQQGAATKLVRIKVTGGDHPLPDPPQMRASPKRVDSLGDGGGILAESALKLVRSAVVGNGGADHGGGIEAFGGPVTLVDSRISRNKTEEGVGAGVDTFGVPVRIVRSTVTRNHAANAGGGVTLEQGSLRLIKTTVANNVADEGSTGVYLYMAKGLIAQSTVSGNLARNNDSGGIDASASSKLRVVNSTITGNRADTDAGGIDATSSSVSLNSVTVARNTADADGNASGTGGGLNIGGGASSFRVVNSIVSLNHVDTTPNDCFGAFTSGGGNLVGPTLGCTGFGGSDILGQNPKLGQLANNGGPTKTLALRKGSPAIGNAVKAVAPKRDQRGRLRGKRPDSGAFERVR